LACGHKIFFLDIPKPQVQATDPTQHEGGKPILVNLQPYKPIVPLSAGARFLRGFTRIGFVVAALVLLCGITYTFFVAVGWYEQEKGSFAEAQCVAKVFRNEPTLMSQANDIRWMNDNVNFRTFKETFEKAGCPTNLYILLAPEASFDAAKAGPPAVFDKLILPFLIGLLVSIICATIIFFTFWTVGWLCAGFTRDGA
jgi:hypothetical protein